MGFFDLVLNSVDAQVTKRTECTFRVNSIIRKKTLLWLKEDISIIVIISTALSRCSKSWVQKGMELNGNKSKCLTHI